MKPTKKTAKKANAEAKSAAKAVRKKPAKPAPVSKPATAAKTKVSARPKTSAAPKLSAKTSQPVPPAKAVKTPAKVKAPKPSPAKTVKRVAAKKKTAVAPIPEPKPAPVVPKAVKPAAAAKPKRILAPKKAAAKPAPQPVAPPKPAPVPPPPAPVAKATPPAPVKRAAPKRAKAVAKSSAPPAAPVPPPPPPAPPVTPAVVPPPAVKAAVKPAPKRASTKRAKPAPAPAVKPAAPATPAPKPVAAPISKPAPVPPAKPAAKPAPKPAPKATRKSAAPKKRPIAIPPILLEGDAPPPQPMIHGLGQRYALGPSSPPVAPPQGEPGELPEAYGTKRLYLTARDPHWLYANWDLSTPQLREYNQLSADGHLVIRLYLGEISGRPFKEIHVHPESRNWLVPAERGGTRFVAELGYYDARRLWNRISTSGSAQTPPDTVSKDASVEFATLPAEVPYQQVLAVVKEAAKESVPLAQALWQMTVEKIEPPPSQPAAHEAAPLAPQQLLEAVQIMEAGMALETSKAMAVAGIAQADTVSEAADAIEVTQAIVGGGLPWTPQREQAFREIVSIDSERRVWVGSLEITELIRQHLARPLSSAEAAQLAARALPGEQEIPGHLPPAPGPGQAPSSPTRPLGQAPEVGGPSSPFGGEQPAKGFWFNVNAELIIYGATEPDATVTIGGRVIQLRKDGTFSYRFALPDGRYELPVVAVSADKSDGRAAHLSFARQTEYRGDVGQHPQDPALKAPKPENIP